MTDIIDLESERVAREPHITFPIRCRDCDYEWQGVVHLRVPNHLDCPRCEWRATHGDEPYPGVTP